MLLKLLLMLLFMEVQWGQVIFEVSDGSLVLLLVPFGRCCSLFMYSVYYMCHWKCNFCIFVRKIRWKTTTMTIWQLSNQISFWLHCLKQKKITVFLLKYFFLLHLLLLFFTIRSRLRELLLFLEHCLGNSYSVVF